MKRFEMDEVTTRLSDALKRGWLLLLLRGVAAIAFGVLTLMQPGISLAALVLLFGVYAIIDGVVAISTAVSARQYEQHWWLLLIAGLVGIAVGFIAFRAPDVTALALLFYIAAWAIARGMIEIVLGIRVRHMVKGEWRIILAGIASVLFGAFLLARPGGGALTVLWLIAVYALIVGVLLVISAFKVRSFRAHLGEMAGPASPMPRAR
jgi:uncharacterized membrane protein HdeD (DUF308 family)